MVPLIDPWSCTKWARLDAAGWAVARAQWASVNSPGGIPVTGVDSITVGDTMYLPSMPSGCSRIDRYTVNNPGRRAGTPLYLFLLHPTATWTGVCWLWVSGSFGSQHDLFYYFYPSTSPMQSALNRGDMVLALDLPGTASNPGGVEPNSGVGPGNPAGTIQQVTVGGVLTTIQWGDYRQIDVSGDGGAPASVLYTDYAIKGCNQVDSDYHPTTWAMAGHSAGGVAGAMIGILDSRFKFTAWLQGGVPLPYLSSWTPGDFTYWLQCVDLNKNSYQDGGGVDTFGLQRLSASWPGRYAFSGFGTSDETLPGVGEAQYRAMNERFDYDLSRVSNRLTHYYGIGQTHFPTEAENAAVMAAFDIVPR